ncbi:hypothetical protein [Halomarina oriensis]|uniref:Uncharacterized protein n=1 Tax=Halomarina oriensis TaxID=671145 RepID=A0A6B0GIZ6_9EURY|nr:hypothetical protein [Halomarina oriensis]MWG33449.1 hypothetical protein [Halomarina oriensis]
MGDVSVILAFAHPLAVVVLSTLWTLHILKKDYRQAIEQKQVAREHASDDVARVQGD